MLQKFALCASALFVSLSGAVSQAADGGMLVNNTRYMIRLTPGSLEACPNATLRLTPLDKWGMPIQKRPHLFKAGLEASAPKVVHVASGDSVEFKFKHTDWSCSGVSFSAAPLALGQAPHTGLIASFHCTDMGGVCASNRFAIPDEASAHDPLPFDVNISKDLLRITLVPKGDGDGSLANYLAKRPEMEQSQVRRSLAHRDPASQEPPASCCVIQ